jgi:hypothetical protein
MGYLFYPMARKILHFHPTITIFVGVESRLSGLLLLPIEPDCFIYGESVGESLGVYA